MWRSRLFYLIGCWILLLAVAQSLPLAIAVASREPGNASGFFASMVVSSVIGGSLFLGFRSSARIKVTKLTLLLPVFGGMSLALAGGLPFFFIFPEQGLIAAIFEGMSLITTTGASAYEGAYDEMNALAFWRAFVGWTGGFLSICLALSILMALNSGGLQLHRSPLPFGDSETGYPRLKAVAQAIAPLYLLMTLLCCTALMLLGESFFVALQLAMSTISTTGIVPEGREVIDGGAVQLVLAVFMIVAVLNWDVLRAQALKTNMKHPYGTETRSLIVILVLATALLFLLVFPLDSSGLWHALFTAISAVSTTGYVPSDLKYSGSGVAAAAIIFTVLACIGGSVASSSGGLKQLRVAVLYLLTRREIDRLAHPHGVKSLKYQGFTVERRDIAAIWLLLGAFVLTLVFGSLSFAILGVDFHSAIAMAVSALTLSGPLIALIDPYFSGFSGLTDADYILLTVLMLLGRVEASIFLAMLAKSFWRG